MTKLFIFTDSFLTYASPLKLANLCHLLCVCVWGGINRKLVRSFYVGKKIKTDGSHPR